MQDLFQTACPRCGWVEEDPSWNFQLEFWQASGRNSVMRAHYPTGHSVMWIDSGIIWHPVVASCCFLVNLA